MKNIVKLLLEAKGQGCNYDFYEIKKGINTIEKSDNQISYDWEEGDEEWISLLKNERRIAIIGVKIPVIFVVRDIKEKLASFVFLQKLFWIEIDDFDEVIWSINIEEYKMEIGELKFHASAETIDLTAFSTNDFWWATI